MDFILIIVGFVILILGAHFLVDGASGLAKRLHVPDLIIGLTIVAFGTSAPELVVNIFAASKPDTTDLALTNILGSNLINTFVILGLAAVIYPISSQKSSRLFDIPLSLFAAVLIFILAQLTDSSISRMDGIILLLFFGLFMLMMIRQTLKHPEENQSENIKPVRIWLAIIMIIGGLGLLIGGADLIVPSAVRIANNMGISQSVIGLTIVALGTSLPELATSAMAAFKKNSDIALGNIVGSNIFNIFLVLGVSGIIRPLQSYPNMIFDLMMVILGSLLILLFVSLTAKKQIKRWHGGLLLFLYLIYITYTIVTQA
ncbi:MAG: sodium:calcium antiporter [Paludibacter sp.]|nr:sodium:calcium antiporter [Paludibacter sp.]